MRRRPSLSDACVPRLNRRARAITLAAAVGLIVDGGCRRNPTPFDRGESIEESKVDPTGKPSTGVPSAESARLQTPPGPNPVGSGPSVDRLLKDVLSTAPRETDRTVDASIRDRVRRFAVSSPHDVRVRYLTAALEILEGRSGASATFDADRSADELNAAAGEMFATGSADEHRGLVIATASLFERLPDWRLASEWWGRAVVSDARPELRERYAAALNRWGDRNGGNRELRMLSLSRPLTVDQLRCLMMPEQTFADIADRPTAEAVTLLRRSGRLNAVRALLANGDTAEALRVLRAAPSGEASTAAHHGLTGRVYAESRQSERLRQWWHDWGEDRNAPDHWNADQWFAAGALMQSCDGHPVAMRCFAEAVGREPGDGSPWRLWRRSAGALGRVDLVASIDRRVNGLNTCRTTCRRLLTGQAPPTVLIEMAESLRRIGRPLEATDWLIAASYRGVRSVPLPRLAAVRAEQVREQESDRSLPAVIERALSIEAADVPGRMIAALPAPTRGGHASPDRVTDPVRFVVASEDRGLDFRYVNKLGNGRERLKIHQAMGGGVAVVDYDRDGGPDLYFPQGGPSEQEADIRSDAHRPDRLLRHGGESSADVVPLPLFFRVTEAAGVADHRYSTAAHRGDWNQDGWDDIVVCNFGRNRLWINQGDGTFRPALIPEDPFRAAEGEVDGGPLTLTMAAAVADVDGDGLPDLYECNYLRDDAVFEPLDLDARGHVRVVPGPLQYRAAADRWFRRNTDGTVSAGAEVRPAGGDGPIEAGLNVVVGDFDGRRGLEVFVANDSYPNRLWRFERSTGDSVIATDLAVPAGVALGADGDPQACMGVAVADFDGDGAADLHVTNFAMQWSNLFTTRRDGADPKVSFSDSPDSDERGDGVVLRRDTVVSAGLADPTWAMTGFGTVDIDIHNDGRRDLVVGNGHVYDISHENVLFQMPHQLFLDSAAEASWRSADVVTSGGDSDNGGVNEFYRPALTRGVSAVDLNRDGREDFISVDLVEPARAFLSMPTETSSSTHWIRLHLVGRRSERSAVGAMVVAEIKDQNLNAHVTIGEGYAGESEAIVHLGCGAADRIDRITIRWPSGASWRAEDVPCDRTYLAVEGEAFWAFP